MHSPEKESEMMEKILEQEIEYALGCTEPGAVALAAAKAREALGEAAETLTVRVSGNVLKNAMNVGIPGTDLKGIEIAAALGCVAGKSEYGLEVLKDVRAEDVAEDTAAEAKANTDKRSAKPVAEPTPAKKMPRYVAERTKKWDA